MFWVQTLSVPVPDQSAILPPPLLTKSLVPDRSLYLAGREWSGTKIAILIERLQREIAEFSYPQVGVVTDTSILKLLLKKFDSNQKFLLKNKFLEAPDLLNQNSLTSLSPISPFLLLGCQLTYSNS
jgi:hypothetical protein